MSEEDEIELVNDFTEIPPIFQSDLTGKPFECCSMCERELLQDGVMYLIEKAIRAYPQSSSHATIFEYAVCFSCYLQMQGELSEESMERIAKFFEDNLKIDWEERARNLTRAEDYAVEPWIDSCILTGKSRSEVEEYQIYAQCDGKYMLFHTSPYMISGEAIEQMVELLSNQTLDELEGFKDQITGPSPEWEELTKRPLILV